MLTATNNLINYALLAALRDLQKRRHAFNHSFRKDRLRREIYHEHTLLALLSNSSFFFYLTLMREEKADI